MFLQLQLCSKSATASHGNERRMIGLKAHLALTQLSAWHTNTTAIRWSPRWVTGSLEHNLLSLCEFFLSPQRSFCADLLDLFCALCHSYFFHGTEKVEGSREENAKNAFHWISCNKSQEVRVVVVAVTAYRWIMINSYKVDKLDISGLQSTPLPSSVNE